MAMVLIHTLSEFPCASSKSLCDSSATLPVTSHLRNCIRMNVNYWRTSSPSTVR